MGIRVESFLGREIMIPEDRLYDTNEGLWMKEEDPDRVAVGITEPTLLMAGAVREVEMLVEDGSHVEAGDTVVLTLTSKLKYLEVPISGTVVHCQYGKDFAKEVEERPYQTPLFYIITDKEQMQRLATAAQYAESLRTSEGARNPGGHKGGVSPTCKAVYMGIGEQKLK
jgi:glycine cleavage system H protein